MLFVSRRLLDHPDDTRVERPVIRRCAESIKLVQHTVVTPTNRPERVTDQSIEVQCTDIIALIVDLTEEYAAYRIQQAARRHE